MKIIFRYAILSLILATSCDEKKVFKLEEDVITSIRKNNNCLMLLDEGFGVNQDTIDEVRYLQILLNKIIEENKDVEYQRLIFLRIYEEGEVITISKLTFGVLKNGKGLLKRYHSDKVESKKIKNIDLELLYKKIGKPQNKIISGRTKILIIDFKNIDDFECGLYDNLNTNDIEDIKELMIYN